MTRLLLFLLTILYPTFVKNFTKIYRPVLKSGPAEWPSTMEWVESLSVTRDEQSKKHRARPETFCGSPAEPGRPFVTWDKMEPVLSETDVSTPHQVHKGKSNVCWF